jgi:2-haloacid dehalogenase
MLDFQKHMSNRGWALLPLRLMVGFGFAAHGYAKLSRGPEAFATVLAAIGVPAPLFTSWVTSLLELFGGISIMAGAFVIPLSIPLAMVMLTAMFTVHLPNGFSGIKLRAVTAKGAEFGAPGYEMNLLYLAALLTLCLGGAGAASLDSVLRARNRNGTFKRLMPTLLLPVLLCTPHGHAAEKSTPRFKAVAFDYFVLFDPNSVVAEVEREFPTKGVAFTNAWRSKQFEYGFLRSITHRHADFFQVTGDALDYTAEMMHLDLTPEKRTRLLNAYLTLKPWPDAVGALQKLRASGLRVITIANFSPTMLRANAEHAGMADLFDELLSTEVNGTYKPDPDAYELGMKHLHLKKEEIIFAAFGGWDAYGARTFGYTTWWVNRFGLPTERLGIEADKSSGDLTALLEFVLGKP